MEVLTTLAVPFELSLAKISSAGQRLCNFLPCYKSSANKLLIGARTGERESREDLDYKTHLARISFVGQGLCNY